MLLYRLSVVLDATIVACACVTGLLVLGVVVQLCWLVYRLLFPAQAAKLTKGTE